MVYPISKSQRFLREEQDKAQAILIVFLAVIFFASVISPQVVLYGRGARLTLPVFGIFVFIAVINHPPSAVINSLFESDVSKRAKIAFLFVIIVLFRYLLFPVNELLYNYFYKSIICILIYILINILRNEYSKHLNIIRFITLIVLGISFGQSLTTLYHNPGVARLTMGTNANALLLSLGLGSYVYYTSVAIASPAIAQWLHNHGKWSIVGIAGWGALIVAAATVIFSTFTMATLLLVFGMLSWFSLVAARGSKAWLRIGTGIAIVIFVIRLPSLYESAITTAPTAFATNKVTNFYRDSLDVGLKRADKTGRVSMFIETFKYFKSSPIFGVWGIQRSFYVGGHSSWADSLALFGILGTCLWMVFLFPSWKRKKPFSVSAGMAGGTIAWFLFIVGGALNPTFYSPNILLLIWLYDDI